MEFRNAIQALFGSIKQRVTTQWREVGAYQSTFSPYNGQLYANETCRSCIRTLSEHTSKANAIVTGNDVRLQKLIQLRPNMYMNGKDFLYKVRTLYEIHNTVFIYINRDDAGRCISLYPVPNCSSEAVESDGMLFIKFYLPNGTIMVAPWDDLAVLRKDYNTSDIFGDSNSAINTSLDLLNTTNQGMANAIKSTANLRGILKSSKAMLTEGDIKKQKDQFVADYMAMTNSSGIAMTDSTVTFTPITLQPAIANYKSIEELRNNIYRYFGMNEKAVTSQLVSDDWEAFYEAQIEPFLIAFGLELTYKIYTERQRGYGNQVVFESNRMQYMSMSDKLALVQMVDRGAMNANQWRQIMNMSPVPGGDVYRLWQNPKNESAAKGADANADKTRTGVSVDEPTPADDGRQ